MKYRKDFVTNSSSSSYIIAMANDEVHTHILDALEKAEDYEETSVGTKITNAEDMNKYILNRCGYESDTTLEDVFKHSSFAKTLYNIMSPAIENDKSILFKEISYDASALTDFLDYLQKFDPCVEVHCLD